MLVIALLMLRKMLDNQSEIIKANSEAQQAAAKAQEAAAQSNQALLQFLNNYVEHMAQLQAAFENHTKTENDASNNSIKALEKHTTALYDVTNTLTGVQGTIREELTGAKEEMRGAGQRITENVNAHTDEAHRITGEAITATQQAFTAQHAGQVGDFKTMMEESERKFRADVHEEVLTNGEKTRADLERQLKPIFEQLAQIQHDAETRDTEMAARIHEISNDLSKVVLMVTAPKSDTPAAPAPTLPPVDPLANIPPKSEEMK